MDGNRAGGLLMGRRNEAAMAAARAKLALLCLWCHERVAPRDQAAIATPCHADCFTRIIVGGLEVPGMTRRHSAQMAAVAWRRESAEAAGRSKRPTPETENARVS